MTNLQVEKAGISVSGDADSTSNALKNRERELLIEKRGLLLTERHLIDQWTIALSAAEWTSNMGLIIAGIFLVNAYFKRRL